MYLPLLAFAAVAFLVHSSKKSQGTAPPKPTTYCQAWPVVPIESSVKEDLVKLLNESSISFLSSDGSSSLWELKPGQNVPPLPELLKGVADNNRIVMQADSVLLDGSIAQALVHESNKYIVFRPSKVSYEAGEMDRSHLPYSGVWYLVAGYNQLNVLNPSAFE